MYHSQLMSHLAIKWWVLFIDPRHLDKSVYQNLCIFVIRISYGRVIAFLWWRRALVWRIRVLSLSFNSFHLNCLVFELSTYIWNTMGLIILKNIKTEAVFVIFWPSTQPKNIIPRWYTGRKWHIPMASNRKRSRGRIKAYDMGQGEGPIVPLQWCTGRELWTAWQLFPLDDD